MATEKTEKVPVPERGEEAALNAELTAAHAEKATEEAEKADLEAKKAAAAESGTKVCPNCRGELIKHEGDNPFKVGAWHCDSCGGCFVRHGSAWQLRPGHTAAPAP